ncbi:NAD-dependent dehydratase [Alkalispirochaeta sphaeroplastigenens]|uniref:NAD-dependent dehydratase n=1 Tax=Alkalispirochaeta sphaeroplastigenens TaxID=1187066 RepID=A0A2S4JNQ3_9SPIO|nr:UDP-glucuronic acid decarboxylase family protein [Alkalispirochaeta sphaeroplastigenens]POR01158.1 NAD-dependent dehydratase [Alkalispirochaeta sphaeroplastigenens]
MRILVAGGAGFIGSHLCEGLLGLGHDVICADNFSTGFRHNLDHLREKPALVLVEQDLTDSGGSLPRAEAVMNLACPASPVQYQRDPLGTLRANLLGTMNLLECAGRWKASFFQASTSEVYGDPDVHPQNELYWGRVNPLGSRACYNEGKRCAETLCINYHRHRGQPLAMARIFNTYGPQMAPDDGRVVSSFIVRALRNEPIELFGGGTQTRSFCYIDDMIEGILACALGGGPFPGPVNLGNPQEISIRALAEAIIDLTNSRSRLVTQPSPEDDPGRRCPDISLARHLYGWEPRTDLARGLLQTISWFDGILSR